MFCGYFEFAFSIIFFINYYHGNASGEKLDEQFKRCCSLGSSWASEDLKCEKFTGPVAGISDIEQGLCLKVVDICCIRKFHEKNCEKGKKDARNGQACTQSIKKKNCELQESDYQRDCCEGCKLGILTGSLGQKCAFNEFSFGNPWDLAFLECCYDTSSSTVSSSLDDYINDRNKNTISTKSLDTTPSTISSSITSVSTDFSSDRVPTPDLDDICQILKGLLCSDICIPTPGSYYCECPKGKILLEDGKTCRTESINRCESDNPCEHRCMDTGTDIKCECDVGFDLANDGHSCNLKSKSSMIPLKPKCPFGYRYNSTLKVCNDINECIGNPCPINNTCQNIIGSYYCIAMQKNQFQEEINDDQNIKEDNNCPIGYQWDKLTQICTDINECIKQKPSPCFFNTHICINTIGSFTCHKLSDMKECPAGFKFDFEQNKCNDVDECAEGLDGCLPIAEECRNTEGAYECDLHCRKGFMFSQNLGICIDINECDALNNPCSMQNNTVCINIPGKYLCEKLIEEIDMKKQFELIKKNDINLNITGVNNIKSSSALTAKSCQSGYIWNGNNCQDIDECLIGPVCQEHERCQNHLGGYNCLPLCSTGWYYNRLIKQCQDVDECLLGRHNCSENNVCKNTNGSYICQEIVQCSKGYQRTDNGTCIDIDECIDNVFIHNCSLSEHQYCVNREGSYDCIIRLPHCTDGYRYSLASKKCEDIDECLDRSRDFPCDARLSEHCVNLPGSYKCERLKLMQFHQKRPACPTGYQYDSKTKNCEDIDECAEKIDLCGEEICYNQPGGYSCVRAPTPLIDPSIYTSTNLNDQIIPNSTTELSTISEKCKNGMKYIRNRGCVDQNECQEIEDACSSNEECINTIGSYICNCRIGFRRDNFTQACVDINECQLLENDCLPSQRCDNTLGSYSCVRFLPCGTGYTLNAATEICEDDDECLLGTHDCSSGYHCRNTLGSYRCDRNLKGQNWTATSKTIIASTTPYSPTTTTTTLKFNKTPSVTNVMTELTTRPIINSRNKPDINCPKGFELGLNNKCIDIDECELIPSICQSPLERCINTMGSYKCESRVICGTGYKFDSLTSYCVDIDECAEGLHQCERNQKCENRQGSYTCSCPPGHTLNSNKKCIDIDECSLFSGNICGVSGHCENTVGSYKCTCDSGFETSLNDNSCQDINECEQNQGICQHSCINVWGSYRCACRSGYRINSDNKSCSDIDECVEFKENNLCVGICENIPGSYSCRCPDGYRLGIDGRTCQDIDECAINRVCQNPNEICQNTRGSYRCNRINCPSGYHRDSERKNRCIRTSRYCPSGDLSCFRSPSHYSFNFITFVSFLPIPIQTGQLELFTMRGTHLPGSIVRFSMALVESRAPPGIVRATESFFVLRRPSPTQAVLCLTRSIGGPQEIELDLSMEIYHSTSFAGSAVAKIFIYVSQYEF